MPTHPTALPPLLAALLLLAPAAATAQTRLLSLREAVALALEHNPEFATERLLAPTASAALLAAQGAFDPALRLESLRRSARNPAASLLEGAGGRLDTKDWRQAASLKQPLPWRGLSWEASWENTRSSTSSPFSSLNPFHSSKATLALSIPLWRNSSTDAPRTELLVRRRQLALAHSDFEIHLTTFVHQVESAYWSWVAARAALLSARDLSSFASDALLSTERLVREGEAADAELAGARATLHRREEALSAANADLEQAENTLKLLLVRDPADPLWRAPLLPADFDAPGGLPLEDQAPALALSARPELLSAQLQLQIAGLEQRLAREARKPALDLNLSYSTQGLAGRAVPSSALPIPGFELGGVPPLLLGGLADASRQLLNRNFPVYQAGLTLELPLRGRAAAGQLRQAELSTQRSALLLTRLQNLITLEVRQSYALLRSSSERLQAARSASSHARLRLESELRLFRAGQSNNLNLNVRQNELAESEQLVIAAGRAQNLARAEVRRVTAQTLLAHGVSAQ